MADYSEGDAELEGEEFEGEDVGQCVLQAVPVAQEPPPECDSKKKTKGKRKKPPPPIRINLSNCKYEVLRIVQRKLGWKEVGDDDDWEIYWTDTSVSIERIMKLTRIQKINHFSGMLEICRKRAMARNLMKMARQFPQHYDFFPRTFILPGDREEFMADIRARGKKQVYILKPDAGCQGRGIRLVQGGKDEVVARVLNEMATPNVVAQHYLSSPLLIHGYKFDLRIYALVLSCDPLRVFLFHEGLARICTEKYAPPRASNLDVSFMHLTNYAVNKKNEAFVAAVAANADSGEDASKWCLAQLRQYLTAKGHNYDKVWADIADLIIKSLCSVQPLLRNNYRSVLPPDNDGFSCFEILGYDIMLDDQLRPWLIEVNHSPSFNIDSPLDLAIKEELITQTIELVRVDPKIIAKTKKAEKRAATSRLLEPMHAKKPPPVRQGGPLGGGGSSSGATAQGESKGGDKEKGESEEGGGSGGGAAAAAAFAKPRTPEEYEALRAKVLAARERYEAKHMGNFTRIFPSPDAGKQALYEELLKGANEIYQASFQARSSKRPEDEKKRKVGARAPTNPPRASVEDAETDAQKAERLKARAHRDKLAQMAEERRRMKKLQQQQLQSGQSLLPAFLYPPQPYLTSSGQSQPPTYYLPLLPPGPYQYDPAVYQHYYHQAYLYGTVVGGQRMSEVYGEGSDGAASVASSRPVSALSSGSGAAADNFSSAQASGMRIYSGPRARAAAAGAAAGSGRPASSAANSGRNSPLGQQQAAAASAAAAVFSQHLQQQQQQQLLQQLQQQGALPPYPFLGFRKRPSSAAARAANGVATSGGDGGAEWAEATAAAAAAAGLGSSGVGAAGRPASPLASAAAGSAAAASGLPGGVGSRGLGLSGSLSFNYNPAAALQQLQQYHQQAAAAAAAAAAVPQSQQSARPVSVGSAHNHVRHAHSCAVEATGAVYAGGPAFQESGPGERDQSAGSGPGSGLGTPKRSLLVNGSRPPSASAIPASLRDKLQPGSSGAAAGAAAMTGGIGRNKAGGSPLGNNAAMAAAATWDAAIAAAAAAAGHDPLAVLQYISSRPRPQSAGEDARMGSPSGGAAQPPLQQQQRSPSPLGPMPASMGPAAAMGVGLAPAAAVNIPGISAGSRTASGRYGGTDMYLLGLTHTLMQLSQPPLAAVAGSALPSGSPKLARTSSCNLAPASPRSAAAAGVTGSGGGGGGGSTGGGVSVATWDSSTVANATGGRAFKNSRAAGVPPHPALVVRTTTPILMPPPSISAAVTSPLFQTHPPTQQQVRAMHRRSEGEAAAAAAEDEGVTLMYQPLGMPDAAAAAAVMQATERYGGGSGVRQWSAAPSSVPVSARQRSFTSGAAGYVAPVVAAAAATAGSSSVGGAVSGGGAAAGAASGGGGIPTTRPPVYPPPGGGPGLRPGGAPTSGRAGGSSGGVSGGGSSSAIGKAAAGGVASGRQNSALTSTLTGAVAAGASHPVLSGGGGILTRGIGGGTGSGSVVGVGALQGGIEGLQITATGLDLDAQMRSAALAALNRKGLTVKGKKVAQQ